MKKKILTFMLSAIFLFTSIPVYAAEKTYFDVFDQDKVIDINIELEEADLQDMYEYAINEEYHIADITIDGIKVKDVGVRTKGNMTLRSVVNSDSDRYSFRVKFDKYVKKQNFLGLDELCLNNGYSDPSYIREYLHYDIIREFGMNSSNTIFCNLYINGEFAGLYLAVEPIDDSYLENRFGENYEEGNLYKMDEGSTLEYKEDENYSYADLKIGDDEDYSEFKEFVKKLNNVNEGEKGDIESFLDVQSALKYIAANTVLCSYDSYNGNMHHNFYLYQTPDGIFTVLPWDYNMSFGGLGGNNSTVGIDTPFVTGSLDTLPLIGKLLSIDEYKEQYYGYIKELMTLLENFEERVDEIKAVIEPSVKKDTTSFYTFEDFEKSTTFSEEEAEKAALADDKALSNKNQNSLQEGQNMNDGKEFGGKGDFDGKEPKDFGGGMFGGNSSIINCVKERLANLEEQFAGKADKVTSTGENGGFGGPNGGHPNGAEGGPAGMPMMPNGQMADFGNMEMQPMDKGGFEFPKDFDPDKMPEGGMFGHGDRNNASNSIRVNIQGHIIEFDSEPVLENGTTLAEAEPILKALGLNVTYSDDKQTLTAANDDIKLEFTAGSKLAVVNGESFELSAAPRLSGDDMLVPVRFIAEKLGKKIEWDNSTKLIEIYKKK